jgi:hypothetical protein
MKEGPHDLFGVRPEEAVADVRDQGIDLSSFEVEAVDGSIGKVDKPTNETGGSYLIVDTGPWIFGKKVVLPAGVITRIDWRTRAST